MAYFVVMIFPAVLVGGNDWVGELMTCPALVIIDDHTAAGRVSDDGEMLEPCWNDRKQLGPAHDDVPISLMASFLFLTSQ